MGGYQVQVEFGEEALTFKVLLELQGLLFCREAARLGSSFVRSGVHMASMPDTSQRTHMPRSLRFDDAMSDYLSWLYVGGWRGVAAPGRAGP